MSNTTNINATNNKSEITYTITTTNNTTNTNNEMLI